MAEPAASVQTLLEALPYIREFHGRTVVIKYGGAAMRDEELKEGFATDVVLLKYVGLNPVIVHGGGPDISRYSDRLGLEVRFVQGLRVTDAPTMELVKMVLVGKINKEIVAQLHLAGAPAVGLAGDDGGLIEAEKASSDEADLGFVGQVASIDPWVLESLSEFVPVVASVGVGADGQSYNINADAVAGRLAAALRARKAIFLTDVEGIFRDIADPASLISECRLRDLRALMASGAVGSGMIPKLGGVVDALEAGVGAVHVLDGRIPHSVLIEIFTEAGIGTKITA
jgi:acetylglutamate kinase